jgi:hypothetical protein
MPVFGPITFVDLGGESTRHWRGSAGPLCRAGYSDDCEQLATARPAHSYHKDSGIHAEMPETRTQITAAHTIKPSAESWFGVSWSHCQD